MTATGSRFAWIADDIVITDPGAAKRSRAAAKATTTGPPPNLADASPEGLAMVPPHHCANCCLANNPNCVKYGDWPVRPDQVCDGWEYSAVVKATAAGVHRHTDAIVAHYQPLIARAFEDLFPQNALQEAIEQVRAGSVTKYSDDEARDDHGRWTSGGGGSGASGESGGGQSDRGGAAARTDATPQILSAVEASGLVGTDAFDALASGRLADTQAIHSAVDPETGERTYSADRAELHEQIVGDATTGHASQTNPQALFTAGGPASGKSGLYGGRAAAPAAGEALAERERMAGPADAVVVDPDSIKGQLPEFGSRPTEGQHGTGLVGAGRADVASAATHEESSDVAAQVRDTAVAGRQNVVVDGIGDSGGSKFADKIAAAQAAGYDVTVRYAVLPVNAAIDRAALRGASSGRELTPEMVTAAHEGVARTFVGSIQNGVPGARVELYDNTSGLTPIATRDGSGSWSINDEAKYNSFVARGQGG